MAQAYLCDGVRTPIGRYGGGLSGIRTDDLGALPLQALMARHPGLDWAQLEEVYYGCVNQAGEDNRNVARMSALLAGLPPTVAAATVGGRPASRALMRATLRLSSPAWLTQP
jgi:acetyl-CoA acetyltransferase